MALKWFLAYENIKRTFNCVKSQAVLAGSRPNARRKARGPGINHGRLTNSGSPSRAAYVFDNPLDLDRALSSANAALSQFQGAVPDEFLADRAQNLSRVLGRSALNGLIEHDPGGAVEALEEGKFDDFLGKDERQALLKSAKAEFEQDLKDTEAADAASRARAVTLLETGIAAGRFGHAAVFDAFDGGFIDETQRDRYLGAAEEKRAEKVRTAELVKRVGEQVAGATDVDLDAQDPEHADAIDIYWRTEVRPALTEMPEEVFTQDMIHFVDRMGVVPPSMTMELRAGILSGEPEEEVRAALRLKNLDDRDADVTAIPEDERNRAKLIAKFAGTGLRPERAVELAEERLAKEKADQERLLGGSDEDKLTEDTGDTGMAGRGGDGKPDEKLDHPGKGTEPGDRPDDSEIPDWVKPILDYVKENPPPNRDVPDWIIEFFTKGTAPIAPDENIIIDSPTPGGIQGKNRPQGRKPKKPS